MLPLALELLRASSWFNDAMAERMRRRGYPLLTPSQSYVMAQLLIGPARPSDLARGLGVSRQAVHQLLRPLVDADLVEIRADPTDGRATLVHPTDTAAEFGRVAAEEHAAVERLLADRIGAADLADLRRIVALDWGAAAD